MLNNVDIVVMIGTNKTLKYIKVKLLLTFSFIVIFNQLIYSCDCYWGGNFLKVYQYSDITIIGKVIKRNYYNEDYTPRDIYKFVNDITPESIIVEVISTLNGIENKKRIEIFSSNGYDCVESTKQFKLNDYYVFSLDKTINNQLRTNNKEKSFYLNNCYETWLKYDFSNKEVIGWIKKKKRRKKRRMGMDKLIRKINRKR